jgi:uncharacterized protein YbjT (DUF2867 family)
MPLNNQAWDSDDLFCKDLPSKFQPGIGRILVTGATGYIGGRLVPELLARGYKVRVMVRGASPEHSDIWPGAEIVVADALKIDSLGTALDGIDTAYYLIHSLLLGPRSFESADITAAKNFSTISAESKIKRIVYLGGLGDVRNPLSPHLRSRAEVAEELKHGRIPITVLRAAIIVGSGSASYEIIKHLVEELPIIAVPSWAKNRCQPIAIRDIIKYLVGVLETQETIGRSFDIGGDDILTYEMMLKTYRDIIQKRVFFIPSPFSNIKAYAYIASLITPVPHQITRGLMEGLRNEVICKDRIIRDLIPFQTLSYEEAIIRAIAREMQDDVHTRWSNAYPPACELAIKLNELEKVEYIATYSLTTKKTASSLFGSFCKVGGKEGWFHSNWIWRLRGIIDRILLGVGLARGRRCYSSVKTNDVIDFWRIEDIQDDKRLLLRAEMKLPGKAWLEFSITEAEKDAENKLSVTAYYDTHSIWGRIYWYLFLPFHHFIFRDLIKEIDKKAY